MRVPLAMSAPVPREARSFGVAVGMTFEYFPGPTRLQERGGEDIDLKKRRGRCQTENKKLFT
jgi:hypothetical protein